MEMTHSSTPAPSWVLQYALLRQPSQNPQSVSLQDPSRAVRLGEQLVPPFPVTKEVPQLPEEIVARNSGRQIVVYVEINTEGKTEKMRIIQSPNPLLNQPVLEALGKWLFRPAEMGGKPAAVKALVGIPLSLSR
jgi:TonB family protein